ncbi:MAG: hypothetical protein ABI596_08920, partial [Pyrinomonadaceae bacterium]
FAPVLEAVRLVRAELAPDAVTPIPKGKLIAYLNPIANSESESDTESDAPKIRRVMDREDLQLLLPYSQSDSSKAINE